MPELNPDARLREVRHLDHEPVSAEDIIVTIADILYEYLPPDSGIEPKEAVSRVLEVIESPLAVEIYEQEMQRRNPRDADRWH